MNIGIESVRQFWDSNPCQGDLSTQSERLEYFREIERRRYAHEPHILEVGRFGLFAGKKVLEVGCGVGTDAIQFARSGADYTGVDLTPAAVALTKERFKVEGFPGRFEVANAEERLPFPDCTFDHVYSFGVIHHSPRPQAIAREIYRVLRPGGTICVMLYNRSSINYYIEIMFLRKLLRWSLIPPFMPQLLSKISSIDEGKWADHRKLVLSGRKLSKEEWISINTDGPHCPLAKVYNRTEAERLFEAFKIDEMIVCRFDWTHWPIVGNLLPSSLVEWLGDHWGWHRMIYASKPVAQSDPDSH